MKVEKGLQTLLAALDMTNLTDYTVSNMIVDGTIPVYNSVKKLETKINAVFMKDPCVAYYHKMYGLRVYPESDPENIGTIVRRPVNASQDIFTDSVFIEFEKTKKIESRCAAYFAIGFAFCSPEALAEWLVKNNIKREHFIASDRCYITLYHLIDKNHRQA